MKKLNTEETPAAIDSFLKDFLTAPAKKRGAAIVAAQAALSGEHEVAPLLVNQATAARMLSVSRMTIFRMVQDGELKPVKIRGGDRYHVDALKALANGGKAA